MTPPTTRAMARRVAAGLLDRVTHGAEEIADRLRPALPSPAAPAAIVVRARPSTPAPDPDPIPPSELGWTLARHVSDAFDAQAEALFPEALLPGSHDPEAIRRMRVGSRRLRTLVQLFRPWIGKKLRRRLERDLKAITRALGPLRDADVVWAQFADASTADDALRRAAAELVQARLAEGRGQVRKQAAKGIEALGRDELRDDLREARRLIIEQLTVSDDIRPTLAERLEVVSTGAFGKTPIPTTLEDREAVHEVRILAKQLRYAYGWVSPAMQHGPGPKRLLKRAQRAVGDARDLDLFLRRLAEQSAALDDEGQHVLADSLAQWRAAVAGKREKVDARILPALADVSHRAVVRVTRDALGLADGESLTDSRNRRTSGNNDAR